MAKGVVRQLAAPVLLITALVWAPANASPLPPRVSASANVESSAAVVDARASRLERLGRPREAEILLRAALESLRSSKGAEGAALAARYAALGANLALQGRATEAEATHRIAWSVSRRAVGENHAATASYALARAADLNDLGRHAEAEKIARQVLANATQSKQSGLPEAQAHRTLAAALNGAGRSAEALLRQRQALQTDTVTLGARSPALARDRAGLGLILLELGRYGEAEAEFRAALDIDQQAYGEGHTHLAADQAWLAVALDAQGRHPEAAPLARRALEIRRDALGDNSVLTAAAYRVVAENLRAQGRHDDAEPLYRKAIDIDRRMSGEKRPPLADDLMGLAANLQSQKREREAEPLLRQALSIRRAALGDKAAATGAVYGRLGANRLALGQAGAAQRLDQKALTIALTALGAKHPQTADAKARLAADLQAQGRHANAEVLLREALAIRREALGDTHPDTARSYDALAQNLDLQQAPGRAEALSNRAVAILRERRDGAQASPNPDTVVALAAADGRNADADNRIYARHLNIAWLAAAAAPTQLASLRDSAFQTAQDLDRSAAGRALAQTAVRNSPGGPAPRDIRRQQDLTQQARRLEGALIKALPDADTARPAEISSALDTVSRDLASAEARLRRDRSYALPGASPALTIGEVQRRLRPHEGLLLMITTGDDIHVFGVTRDRVAWNRLSGRRATIESSIRTLRCQVDDRACGGASPQAALPVASTFDTQGAYQLYQALVAPVETALVGADRLFVTSSGPLAGLPLSLLVTAPPRPGQLLESRLARSAWLGDRYALTTLPAITNLRPAQARPKRAKAQWAFMGYGDPVLTGSPAKVSRRGADPAASPLADPAALRSAFPSLPGAGAELRAMAKVLDAPPESLRMGSRATEASVKTSPALSRAKVIDFATHGLLSNEVKGIAEPGLLFTPPAQASAQDDGVLTASEAAQLHLTADWVILSACNTGGADAGPGAGSLSGLARAFLYAGAKALLVSHWRVYDDSTAALTVETLALQRANPRITKAQALQKAMITVRTGRRPDGSRLGGWTPEWAHPAYWAPFVLISAGD